MEPHVLILSTRVDESTDEVVNRLVGRGVAYTRINTEDYPFSLTLSWDACQRAPQSHIWPPVSLTVDGKRLDYISSLWFRRVRAHQKPDQMAEGVYAFCLEEARAFLQGVGLTAQTSNRIMSPPDRIWQAENKPFQLAVAREVGLSVPDTVISNDPQTIRDVFSRFNGLMIAKAVRTGFVDCGEMQYSIYTSQVLESHLVELESARWSPTIYQPLIAKRCDVRVTVVGEELFVAEIESQTDPAARIDWRHTENPHLPHRRASLPPLVEQATLRLMRRLGLNFGAIDFVLTPDGEYIFLEVNPNGQWLWLDDILSMGISDAVATWLSNTNSATESHGHS